MTLVANFDVSDSHGGLVHVQAEQTIVGANDAPETNAAVASGNEDTAIAVALSGSDVDGTIASFQISTLPAHGTLYSDAGLTQAIALNGTVNAATIYFKPDANWSGATAFQYAAIDNGGLADATPAMASIDIAAVADAPIVHAENVEGAFESAGNFSVTDPYFTTVGDFNGDGKLDLAVSNFPPAPGGSTVSIMLGDGAGHFGAPTAVGVGGAQTQEHRRRSQWRRQARSRGRQPGLRQRFDSARQWRRHLPVAIDAVGVKSNVRRDGRFQ